MIKLFNRHLFLTALAVFTTLVMENTCFGEDRASESIEIKRKLYPKKSAFELSADFGQILNQSYISSYLAHFNGTYFFSESSGFAAEFALAINSDKYERVCIENFYNDAMEQIGPVCSADGQGQENLNGVADSRFANMGPAYPAIREIKNIISGAWVWAPIYGKQLFFMSGVGHFDVYTTVGGGVVMSDYYNKKLYADDGRQLRGTFPNPTDTTSPTPGVGGDEIDFYGKAGRPKSVPTTSPMITLGVGQKYHFTKNFNAKIEIRNYSLIGVPGAVDLYFAVWGGLGVRF